MRLYGKWILAVSVGLSVFFPFSAAALITVGNLDIPGQAESVAVVDGVAYVVSRLATPDPGDSGLKVIDVSDPTEPVELSAVNTPGHANKVVVVDGLAYVIENIFQGGTSPGRLRIIDVSDPAAPVEVGVPIPLNTVVDFAVADGFAYVVDVVFQPRGPPTDIALRIFDVSNPAAPVEFDRIELFATPLAVDVVGGVAYLADLQLGLLIIDVSNPAAPVQLSTFGTAAFGITVVGGVAYLADLQLGLLIVDVSNPAVPVELGSGAIPIATPHLAVEDGNPYLAYLSRGLRLIDISNPAAPVGLDGMLDPTYGALDVAIAGGLAYVVGASGLAVVDLSNPAFPAEISSIESESRGVTVEDGLAYTVREGLRVIDVSNPTSPAELGSIFVDPFGIRWEDVAVAGGWAYVADNGPSDEDGLRIISVGNPAAPFPVAFVPASAPMSDKSGVAVAAELAYLVNRRSGLLIVNVSNPAVPVEIFRGTGGGFAIEVVGGVAYVVGSGGLRLIDVLNPAVPAEVGAINTPGRARSVAVAGGLAYVGFESSSGGYDGLWVIDVSIPAAPVVLGAVRLLAVPENVAVTGGLAYVATRGAGLRLIDVSNPAAPVELAGVGVPSEDVAAGDGLAYVVGGRNLRIIDFGPEYTGNIQIEIDIMPGGDPNSINPSLGGDLPVAILGSDSFDVANVEVTTLAFGPSGASIDHSHGPHFEDLNGDGSTDLMLHFRIKKTEIEFGDRMACLRGETLDGRPFSGCDDVRTVPDMDGDALLDVEEAAIGTHPLNPDTDGDGFDDGKEVLELGTDPLDPLDPTPDPVPERRRKRMRRR